MMGKIREILGRVSAHMFQNIDKLLSEKQGCFNHDTEDTHFFFSFPATHQIRHHTQSITRKQAREQKKKQEQRTSIYS
jgi:hypothetical protein